MSNPFKLDNDYQPCLSVGYKGKYISYYKRLNLECYAVLIELKGKRILDKRNIKTLEGAELIAKTFLEKKDEW